MCCLFGLIDYKGNFNKTEKELIATALAVSAEARGTDATGIAFNVNGHTEIQKDGKPAHSMVFDIDDKAKVIMGHTRLTTQGTERRNYNNHPFKGKGFSLAHNGVLYNDIMLRQTEQLPDTTIETDSYIAVQLIEKQDKVGFDSLKYMAEKIEGSYCFTVLTQDDELYFVKGTNPMCIYDFGSGVMAYASTETILTNAIKNTCLANVKHEKIVMEEGDIYRVSSTRKGNASIKKKRFTPSDSYGRNRKKNNHYNRYPNYGYWGYYGNYYNDDDYYDDYYDYGYDEPVTRTNKSESVSEDSIYKMTLRSEMYNLGFNDREITEAFRSLSITDIENIILCKLHNENMTPRQLYDFYMYGTY